MGGDYVASSKVDDYKYCPEAYISLSLYDWTRLSVKVKVSHKVNDKMCFQFLPGHGQRAVLYSPPQTLPESSGLH